MPVMRVDHTSEMEWGRPSGRRVEKKGVGCLALSIKRINERETKAISF